MMPNCRNEGRSPDSWKGKRLRCFKCGHQWISRSDERPLICPECRSRRYDVPSDENSCTECIYHASDDAEEFHCNQCNHVWISRISDEPLKCPRCKSRNWKGAKLPQFTCRKCGHVWRSKIEHPDRCPSCRSKTWDKDTFKLKCFRCGHKWIMNNGASPDSVRTCPSCRSTKWNELPVIKECFRCGRPFILSKRNTKCPECRGEESRTYRCGFCGMEWVSSADGAKVCPECGLVLSEKGNSEKLTELWENDSKRLNYLFKDGIGCIYLWDGPYPVSCRYLNEVLEESAMSFSSWIKHAMSERYAKFWNGVIDDMISHKDDYKENIPYLKGRLGLDEDVAEILALHFTGMSPEVISVRSNRTLKDIRMEFTKIQEAYNKSGIVVNDSVYTDDPVSSYEEEKE